MAGVVLKNFSRRIRELLRFSAKPKAAILIVHGGDGPAAGDWLSVCLKNIKRYTNRSDYRIYLWNNTRTDITLDRIVKSNPEMILIDAPVGEKLRHPHASALQKLYELARQDHMDYVVTMDTDTFPVRDCWLDHLIRQLDDEAVLAGVWRDELKEAIDAYVHPSCLCTTAAFVECHRLRFDDVDISPEIKQDTLSHFTRAAKVDGKNIFKLKRSNKNQIHYLMGGLYGDWIYHHGAGSRKKVTFWGEEKSEALLLKNKIINQSLQRLVFDHERCYMQWLMGKPLKPSVDCTAFHTEIEYLKQTLAKMDASHA